MTKSKKFTIILCSILFAFLGFFGIFLATSKDSIVKADSSSSEAYMFQSSSLIIPYSRFTSTSPSSSTGTTYLVNINFTFGLSSNYNFDTRGDYAYLSYSSSNGSGRFMIGELPRGGWINCYVPYNGAYFLLAINLGATFNYNVEKVIISNDGAPFNQSALNSTSLTYYDVNGNSLKIQNCFRNDNSYYNAYHSDYRTYWFVSSSDLTDNQFYNAGVEYGEGIGKNAGFNEGYQKAIEENKSTWEQIGYNRGIQDANDYTFLGLIGATIDAPISALFGYIDHDSSSPTYNQRVGGFFNFELLGVNLKDFFFAVLSFAVVIVIVRFALGK